MPGTFWQPLNLYVSGGMTGWPDNNQQAFDEAAAMLRRMGHEPTTPVEWGRRDGEVLAGDGWNASDDEYEGFLERDLAMINRTNFDGVVFIQGWQTSGGAGREGRQAIEQGLRLFTLGDGVLLTLSPEQFLENSRIERLRPEEVSVNESQ